MAGGPFPPIAPRPQPPQFTASIGTPLCRPWELTPASASPDSGPWEYRGAPALATASASREACQAAAPAASEYWALTTAAELECSARETAVLVWQGKPAFSASLPQPPTAQGKP